MSLFDLARTYRRRGPRYTPAFWVTTHLRPMWDAIDRTDLIYSLVNESIVNQFVAAMEPRPARLSTKTPYTSWASLTDQTYSGRHLPPWPDDYQYQDVSKVTELFSRRLGQSRSARKSTLLFPFFAQWFVDGFLRTDPDNPLKNKSTHQIDLCQLYGYNDAGIDALRSHTGGRLKSEAGIDGEYPPTYFDSSGNVKREFAVLDLVLPPNATHPDDTKAPRLGAAPGHPSFLAPALKEHLFAVALPRGNIHYGSAMMSTIFLREHNRLAGLIAKANSSWDDERIFQTARATLIVILVKIVIEEYINHITPFHFQFRCEPGVGATRNWLRPNWMSIEFNMLYRWHSLAPDSITVAGQEHDFGGLRWDMSILRQHGVERLVHEASHQPCSEIGLLNTPSFLLEAEKKTVEMGQRARLAGYNDYRQACGYPRLRPQAWADVSARAEVRDALKAVYPTVDDIELYPGLFAEDVDPGGVLPDLMGTMVGVDAFSQVYTNPLLDPRLFSVETFSRVGMQEIQTTESLGQIVARGLSTGGQPDVSFDLV